MERRVTRYAFGRDAHLEAIIPLALNARRAFRAPNARCIRHVRAQLAAPIAHQSKRNRREQCAFARAVLASDEIHEGAAKRRACQRPPFFPLNATRRYVASRRDSEQQLLIHVAKPVRNWQLRASTGFSST